MNGKEASEVLGITYRQLGYFVDRIDAITKKETSQGHPHDLTFLDLVFLKLAAIMRADKIRLDDINDAISLVVEARKIEMKLPGTLIYRPDIYKNWFPENIFIDPLKKGRWMWTPRSFETAEKFAGAEAGEHFMNRIPGMLYSVAAIVGEINELENNQLELEFNPGKEVYEETQVK